MKNVLLFSLIISVGLNGWLIYQLHQQYDVVGEDGYAAQTDVAEQRLLSAGKREPTTPGEDTRNKLPLPVLSAQLKGWFNTNDPRFYSALTEALRAYPDNWDLLLLEAEWVKRESTLSDAIIQYYKILEKGPPFELQTSINTTINTLLEEAIQKLRLAGDWETLAVFIEPLYQFLPDNRILTIQLADAYGKQSKFTLMENVLASLPDDDINAARVRKAAYATPAFTPPATPDIERRVSNSAYTMAVTRQGDHFLAPISLNTYSTSLLIDTGASVTSVTFDVFKHLRRSGGIKNLGRFTVNTAGGQVEATMILLENVDFGPHSLKNVAIMVMPENTLEGTDGLLGMNILRRFDFHLDQRNSVLLLNTIH